MEDPGITRLDIDLYRRTLKLALSDAVRKETLALSVIADTKRFVLVDSQSVA